MWKLLKMSVAGCKERKKEISGVRNQERNRVRYRDVRKLEASAVSNESR